MTNATPQKPPWQPRFGLGSLMLVILVCAMTAAAGKGALDCYKRPRVAVYSTGDEIIRPGDTLEPGQV